MDLEISNFNEGTLLPGTSLPDLGWDVLYEANELPDAATPVWIVDDEGTVSVTAGVLRINDTGKTYYYRDATSPLGTILVATGFTIEAKVKVVTADGDWAVQPYWLGGDASGGGEIDLKNDRVKLITGGGENDEYLMDTTDDFHIYHLTIIGDVQTLYVDRVQRLQLTNTGTLGTEITDIYWGNMGNAACDAYYDYLYYSAGGAFVP